MTEAEIAKMRTEVFCATLLPTVLLITVGCILCRLLTS